MLVLSRKVDEVIEVLTDNGVIEIAIVAIRGDKVRLGVSAPKSVIVHRQEVALAIRRDNAAAANERVGFKPGEAGEVRR